ncbi:MAG: nuclease [Candidatus Omnitrophica bacterium]|nr:nuclease [Candidatus Omnitrophota bacterium]
MPNIPSIGIITAMKQAITDSTYRKLLNEISSIYEKAQHESQCAVNKIRGQAYREIGRRIIEVEQKQQLRAEYGSHLLERLSEDLTRRYGKGFSITNLKYMRRFFVAYAIRQTSDELDWSHYQVLSIIKDDNTREYYEDKALKQRWSCRELKSALRNDKVQFEAGLHPEEVSTEDENTMMHPEHEVVSLPVERGTLHTYQIAEQKNIPVTGSVAIVDCGFDHFRHIPCTRAAHFKAGDIITAVKEKDGYSLVSSDVQQKDMYTYVAYLDRVVDGDTIIVTIDCGFGSWMKQRLRLRRIDAPEIDSQKGMQAMHFIEKVLSLCPFIIIKTYGSDKYDRFLVDIFYLAGENDPEMVNRVGSLLNEELLTNNLATRWQQ